MTEHMCNAFEYMEENVHEYRRKSEPVKDITPEMVRQEQQQQSQEGYTWRDLTHHNVRFDPARIAISDMRYFQLGKQSTEDYVHSIWTVPSRAQRRDLYDASWLEPHGAPEPRPQPPPGHEALQSLYNMYVYHDFNADVPAGYKRVKITREQFKIINDLDQKYIYPFHEMHNDTDYEEMLIEQRYTKKWSIII